MRTSDSLLRNYRYIATIVLARIKANGNFNDASLERLHSVSGFGINGVLSPMYMMIAYGMTKLKLGVRVGESGAELGECQGGHCPPKFCLDTPVTPQNFSGLFLKALHRPLTAPLVAKLAPPVAPQMKMSGSAFA